MLRHQIAEGGGGPPIQSHLGGPPQHSGPAQAPPPALGHGPSNLFGGIMANQGGQGGPGLAPPPQDQQQPPQHPLQQPAPAAPQGPPQTQQGSFPGYQPSSAMNGKCDLGGEMSRSLGWRSGIS